MSDIRLSDIYKSRGEGEQPREGKGAKQQPPGSEKDPVHVTLASLVKCADTHAPQLEDGVLTQWYKEAMAEVSSLYTARTSIGKEGMARIDRVLDRLMEWRTTYKKQLIEASITAYPRGASYLIAHPVNVCVITALMGDALSFGKREVRESALAAFFHDIGMSSCAAIADQERVLTKEEMGEVRAHPGKGVEMLSGMAHRPPEYVTQVIAEEHERCDGSGYPTGIKEDRIHPYAQLIGVVDVYEALMHTRPYRNRLSPLETIKFIVEKKAAFSGTSVKALIETIGIFPVCQLVRLSTKEVARVVRENPRQPLRPVVEILVDAYGNTLRNPKRLDLGESSLVYIEECLEIDSSGKADT